MPKMEKSGKDGAMDLHPIRRGHGPHCSSSTVWVAHWRSWETILDTLAAEREVIVIDLPGFRETQPLPGEVSIRTLADAVTDFLTVQDPSR